MHAYTLEGDGFYRRNGAFFFPFGVNYWPASCDDDQDMWARWPGKEIQADLGQIAQAGFNAVRVTPPAVEGYRVYTSEFVRLGVDAGLAVLVAGSDAFVRDGSLPGRAVEGVAFSARPGSHVLGHDGLLDPFFHGFLPFGVDWARRRQPAIVGALGFGEPAGARHRDTFLRASLPAAFSAGAAGLFWRGWRDVGSFNDGLLDASGRAKPGLEFFSEFGRSLSDGVVPVSPRDVVGLLGRNETPPATVTLRRLLLARHMVGLTGRSTVMVSEPPSLGKCRKLVVAGVSVGAADIASLLGWVEEGGELFWHGPDLLDWNSDLEKLLGARPIDWRSVRGISVNAFGERFTMAHFPRDVRAELEPCGATVLATDQQGLPVLLENQIGRGRVRFALPLVEEAIVPVAAHPTARDRWAAWYRGMLAG